MPRVYVSRVIPAPIADVWAIQRHFCVKTSETITLSEIEGDAAEDQVGCIRRIETVSSDDIIREQLVSLSDNDYSLQYKLLAPTDNIKNYIATIKLHPITYDDTTFIEWSSIFDCERELEEGLIKLLKATYNFVIDTRLIQNLVK